MTQAILRRKPASHRRPCFSYRTLLLAGFLLIISPLVVIPSLAASPQAGNSHLEAIEITGSRFASKQIVAAAGVRTGSAITREGLQQIADKLSALGAFATVSYHFTTVATGVRVIYEVTDAPAIAVTFDNFPWFSDQQLSDALRKSVVLFDGSAPASGALVDSMDDALMKYLDAQGIHAQVTHKAIPLTDKDGQVQQFHVEEGSFLVQAVEFSDPLAKSDPHIQDRLVDVVGQPFSRNKLEIFEFEQVRPVYLAHAYLQAKFGVPAVRFAALPANPLAGAIIITAQIDPGPAYKFGGISWSGNSGVSSADLNGVVQMQAGSPADGNEMDALWKRVLDKYEQAGYLSADIHPAPNFDAKAGTVSYAVNITEGPQYHMGNLVLTGLSVEGERRIRKAFPIPADALFDKAAYQIFMDKGLKAAFSGLPVHYDKIGNFLQLDTPNSKVDVLLDFQ
jgi:outer membrane protein assembly factor BamA